MKTEDTDPAFADLDQWDTATALQKSARQPDGGGHGRWACLA